MISTVDHKSDGQDPLQQGVVTARNLAPSKHSSDKYHVWGYDPDHYFDKIRATCCMRQ
jgi:pullulanase/glycogen debranching enzyme